MLAKSSQPQGEVFLDARGNGRAMRLTWHHEADVVVLSMWRDQVCAGTFRLAVGDVASFVDAMVDGLRDAPGVHVAPRSVEPSTRYDLGAEPAVPPRQRSAGAAASIPETGQVALRPQQEEEAAEPEQEHFADWAFGPDPRRATAS